ncbi:permease [Isosphaeraceae bacterium EP7]
MNAAWAFFRKQLGESRWNLGLSAAALLGLSYLLVYVASRAEGQVQPGQPDAPPMNVLTRAGQFFGQQYMMFLVTSPKEIDFRRAMAAARPNPNGNGRGTLRAFGGSSFDNSSIALEVALWNHPFILLPLALWAIGRGTGGVAGEIEKGGLDLVLSRPMSRTGYLANQVAVTLLGLVVLGGALIVGNQIGGYRFTVLSPPRWTALLPAALNYAALGLAMYGVTLWLSSMDVVRWRPTTLASMLALGSFILHVIVNLPTMEEYLWMDKFSIYHAYDPVEAVVKGEVLRTNLAVLGGIGGAGLALAFTCFAARDLPANS